MMTPDIANPWKCDAYKNPPKPDEGGAIWRRNFGGPHSGGINAVLETGGAPSARAQQMYELLKDWRDDGGSRLDADLNGEVFVDFTATPQGAENKLRLGGIAHAARGFWALGAIFRAA